MTAARRVLPFSLARLSSLAPALLAALLFTSAFEVRATDLTVDSAVTRVNNGVILDGDGKIVITNRGSITVNAGSPNTLGGFTSGEGKTGIFLRGRGTINIPVRGVPTPRTGFFLPSNNNIITNDGEIIVSGDSSKGINVGGPGEGEKNELINNGFIRASGNSARGVEFSPNSRITNNNTIETRGNQAGQAILIGPNSTINNNGLIQTNNNDNAAAIAIEGSGGTAGGVINNNARGRILQTGNNGRAINVRANVTGFTVNNAGEITASGTSANSKAVHFQHNSANSNNTLINSGTITSNANNTNRGENSPAVAFGGVNSSDGNNSTGNKLTNTGTITTTGTRADGVNGGNKNIILNGKGGRIITNGRFSTGIDFEHENRITNDGEITTSGGGSEGIDVSEGNTVINNGIIKTSGNSAEGIDGFINNIITNNGAIETTGEESEGIDVSRDKNRVTNNGNITTSGNKSYGIDGFEDNTLINTEKGAITTRGNEAHGIRARSSNRVRHSGTITTGGNKAYGIKAGDASLLARGGGKENEINSSGAITTTGAEAAGIWMTDDNTLDFSGRITTTGADAPGIQAGNDNTLTLNGAITTSNRNSHGVVTGTGTKLTIGANSRITTTGANSDGIRIGGLRAGSTALNQRGHIEANATGITAPYISRLENSGRIIGRTGDGVRLTAPADSRTATVENSGTIQGQTHGLNYGIHAITRLQNSGTIMGTNESGVTFTGTTTNPVTVTNSGKIQGGTYGLNYGNNAIVSLQNTTRTSAIRGGRNEALRTLSLATLNNEGTIASNSAAAITLTGTAPGRVTVTNSGTIQGATYGLNYGRNAIAELQNTTRTSAIRGGRNEALSAASLTTLNNEGTIASTSTAAITLTGSTTQTATVSNSGTIQGQTHGLDYGAHVITRLTNSGAIIGTTGAGVTFTGNTTQAANITNTGTIRGGTYGLNYGNNPIASLTNTSPRTLRGGRREALSAGSLLTLNNSGTILSDKASAIRLTRTAAQAATITNSGTIQGNIHGLDYNNNAIATLTNSGTIRGTTGIGVKAAGLTTLNNTGTIEGNTGIQITRAGAGQTGATINNAGTLRSLKGSEGTALDLQGPGQDTLNLQAGSTLEGQVRWDGQDDTLNLATGPARLTLIDNNAEPGQTPTPFTINTNGRPFLLNTTTATARGQAQTTVTVLDPARIHTRTESTQSQWTGAVFQSLAQQQGTRTGPNARNSTAAVHQTLWVRPFGGLHNFKRDGLTPAARYRYGGALAGYAVASTDWQAGGFVGAAQDTLAARGPGADAEGRHVFAGAYATTRWQALNLKAGLLFGQSRTETEWQRLNNQVTGGQERVVYEGRRYFVSPELGLATRLTVRGVALEPALSLRYLGLFGAEEDERLVAGREPLRFRAEDRHVGLVRASVGMPLRFPVNAYGGQLYGQLRVGAEGRKRFGGERIEARRGDGVVRFKVADEATVRGFMGAGFEYVVPDLNLSFSADLEASYGSEAVLGVEGQLGVVWGF